MEFERARGVAGSWRQVESTGSTNADLVAAATADPGLAHLSVLLTRDQRAGRGRLDRVWRAPAGGALAVSVLVRVGDVPPAARGWIPLVAGAAMTDAVAAQLPGGRTGLKWPNDVLVGGRKICGILAEAVVGSDAVVIGSGVNTAMREEDLPVPTATSFAALGAACDEDALVTRYLGELDRLLRALATDPDVAREAVRGRCLTLGREVTVSLPDGSALRGVASAIDDDGRLVVDGRTVSAGDVVHVR
ncbi:biotin--[acetyl-CoA-carboxylase] ligase [Microbacterium marinilacus]|uniref:biotin--[biotin carboxyl-carrier protein] ligase n=1 Tax=Microbacterium marinilacus TaxID=415209 RepID=A0ABP7B936_9MICO|nr:biotin--[acetyl-CoA-carboxylase] ligase [Microbacterium marinilacus]MBY0687176.1 biotin--[acetyl-CoA-carboxylase] ligase [Microbacterium marinilacus]